MKVSIQRAANNESFWHVKARNGRKISTAGETFLRPSGARKSFVTLASGIRAMSDAEFAEFMAGLNTPESRK